jgi:hypothetical protein
VRGVLRLVWVYALAAIPQGIAAETARADIAVRAWVVDNCVLRGSDRSTSCSGGVHYATTETTRVPRLTGSADNALLSSDDAAASPSRSLAVEGGVPVRHMVVTF